ncbi:DUF695 domain-containing protein [Paenibacillus lignilyticus]|uniref:DUF695 domain-containing protein n=1 Tax=Paenibacillus lignilyticus TaxID=1172615 RepID=A0ABS5C9X9_9BACL|nr:DUF695 domain-containing protein [Paenibacillus lignilyticus]MBP3962240.1 DUF695 domain-containing protein [Paenibacillus lignilyticus]
MSDNWGFYERRTESEQLRVLINVGFRNSAPLAPYTDLLSITINLYPVRAHNRSNRDFVKQLEQLESKLEQWLKSTAEAIYIGRINAATRLEFYYYTKGESPDLPAIHAWLDQNWPFRAQVYRKADPQWEFYRFMLPDALEELFVHNAQMIYALIHKGDNIGQPRNVYHWLLFREDDDRREIESMLKGLGYVIEKEKEGNPEKGYPYPLVISRFEDVRLDTVNERVRELHSLLAGSGGRYDGWGSVMKLSAAGRFRRFIRRNLSTFETTLRKLFLRRNSE